MKLEQRMKEAKERLKDKFPLNNRNFILDDDHKLGLNISRKSIKKLNLTLA